jgi:hypothetical protein
VDHYNTGGPTAAQSPAEMLEQINRLERELERREADLQKIQALCKHAYRIEATNREDTSGRAYDVHSMRCVSCHHQRVMWEFVPK